MKKILSLFSALSLAALLMLPLCSCGTVNKNEQNDKKEVAALTPAFDSYNAYVEMKAELFSDFTSRLYGEKDLVQSAGGSLLLLSSADIEFLPLALLQDAERSGGHFSGNAKGCYGCDAVMEAGVFSLEYTTYGGMSEKITGSFDEKTGTLFCEKYKDGVVCASMEYTLSEKGYKAQYAICGDEDINVIRIVFGSEGCGFSQFNAESAERIDSIPAGDFLDPVHILIYEKDGEISASMDGECIG